VIRKHMGYSYIAAAHAEDIDRFYQRHFNPYLNFHRPCGQPERITDARGKEKYVYRRYATPWETLRYLSRATPDALGHLRPELSIQGLERIANSTATPRQPGECKKPSGNSSSASGTSVRAHEKRRAPWKTRKTKPRFPSFPPAFGNRCAIPTFPPRLRLLSF